MVNISFAFGSDKRIYTNQLKVYTKENTYFEGSLNIIIEVDLK